MMTGADVPPHLPMETSMSLFTRKNKEDSRKRLATTEVTIFAMLGALMFCSKIIMAFLFGFDFEGMIAWIVAGLLFRLG